MSDEEDYEALREKNIAERNEFMKDFLKEIKENIQEINELETTKKKSIVGKENKTPRSVTRKRRSKQSPTFHGTNLHLEFRKKYNTRSRGKKSLSSDQDNDDEWNSDKDIIVPKKGSNLKVMFPWSRPLQRDIDLMNLDIDGSESDDRSESDDEYKNPKKKRVQPITRSTYDPNTIPSPDEITQKMLDKVAKKATGKKYDAVNGTCCHQCRQKTSDTKTVCRSGECVGVRGQFCGPCLLGRYGESAIEALKDPNWACPVCRGLCNCSICRTRNGIRPTGILAPIAREEGYNSVKDYLEAVE